MRREGEEVPAWLAEKAPVGGAVFSSRTAGNDAYQPPADPPRQALSSCPARCSVFFFLPGSPGASLGCIFPDTAPQSQKQDRAPRDS